MSLIPNHSSVRELRQRTQRVGGGSGNGPASRDSLSGNFHKARDQFPTSPGGYFGTGRSGGKTRQIHSRDPLGTAKKMFKILSKGGTVAKLPKPGAMTAVFKDGSRVNFRPTSASDGGMADNPETAGQRVSAKGRRNAFSVLEERARTDAVPLVGSGQRTDDPITIGPNRPERHRCPTRSPATRRGRVRRPRDRHG